MVFRIEAAAHSFEKGCIRMTGFGSTSRPGFPDLPEKTFCLSLDEDAEVVDVEVLPAEARALPGIFDVFPVPPFIAQADRDGGQQTEQVEAADAYSLEYSRDAVFPAEPAEFTGTGRSDGSAVVLVRFTPMRYNPLRKAIWLTPSVEVRVHFRAGNSGQGGGRTPGFADAAGESAFEKPGRRGPAALDGSAIRTVLLVVGAEAVRKAAGPFLFWKRCLGDSARFLSIETALASAAGSDRSEKLRNALAAEYRNRGITDVLLIGHREVIPVKTLYPNPSNHGESGAVPSDLYFADLDGNWDSDKDGFAGEFGQDRYDWMPELRVGRLPWSDPAVVSGVLDRFIRYEREDAPWKQTPLLVGGIENYRREDRQAAYTRKTDGAALMEHLRANVFKLAPSAALYETEGVEPSAYARPGVTPLNRTNLFSAWSNGEFGFATWWLHGRGDAIVRRVWVSDDKDGVPEYEEIQGTDLMSVANLPPNPGRWPVVYANACENGWPEKTSLGRVLLRSGCTAVLASSRVSFYIPGWDDPSDGGNASLTAFFWREFAASGLSLGEAVSRSRAEYLKRFSSSWQHWQNTVTLMTYGDPTLSVGPRRPVNGTVKGRVLAVTAGDTAACAASVSLKGTSHRAWTDGSGDFSFECIPSGQYEALIEVPGRTPFDVALPVTAGEYTDALCLVPAPPVPEPQDPDPQDPDTHEPEPPDPDTQDPDTLKPEPPVNEPPVPGPALVLLDTALAATLQEGHTGTLVLRLSNGGGSDLIVRTIPDDSCAWLEPDTSSHRLAPGASDSVSICLLSGGLARGLHRAWVRLHPDGAVSGEGARVPLSLEVVDTIPPAPVRGLCAAAEGPDTLTVTWEPTGDDGSEGTASRLELHAGRGDADSALVASVAADSSSIADRLRVGARRLLETGAEWISLTAVDDAGLSSWSGRILLPVMSGVGETTLPRFTRLEPNYPNPFNASTRIAFTISRPGPVRLSLIDARGREVRVLADGHFEPGLHDRPWNAQDGSGRPLPSGVYLVRLSAPGLAQNRKILLLR